MSRFGDLMKSKKASAPEPVAPAPSAPTPPAPVEVATPEATSIAPEEVVEEEEVVDETPDLSSMSKSELEEYGREIGVELDKRHSRKRLIGEIEEALDTL